ncbi:MAG: hypothetical protein K6D02_07285 [Lachnospiraceae bacterium]|nr:hypothetical protein [Lachnospiraceae bacterium]
MSILKKKLALVLVLSLVAGIASGQGIGSFLGNGDNASENAKILGSKFAMAEVATSSAIPTESAATVSASPVVSASPDASAVASPEASASVSPDAVSASPTASAVTEEYPVCNYMKKKVKVKWDLKKGKKKTLTSKIGGIGKKNSSVTLKSYKITNASKKNYKKLVVKFQFKDEYTPNSKEIKKVLKYYKKHKAWHSAFYFTVVDKGTGLSLEGKNKVKVKVKQGKWKFKNTKVYADNGAYMSKLNATIKVTITYPKTYKRLCIAAGSENTINEDITATAFFKGLNAFGETSLYKKGKKNSHWMVVK